MVVRKYPIMADFDWDHLRSFLAVARTGRLTAAAARMGSEHTTLARRISALEHALHTRLFDRSPAGYALTEHGERLMPLAEQVETLALTIADAVAGETRAIEGVVRIASPEGFGSYFLAPRLTRLRDAYPGLAIQLLAGSGMYSLSKREADIVIALRRPPEGRLVATKLTDYDLGLYASADYLDRHGPIADRAAIAGHPFIGYVADLLPTPELDYLQQVSGGAAATVESSNILAQVQATIAGGGLCVLPAFIARREPGLVAILPHEIRLKRAFWMLIHADHRDRARLKVAAKFIADEVRRSRADFVLPG